MKKVLIVEDDANINAALAIRMKGAGCAVLRASDGASGLALAREEKPDLIISDIKMAVGDGLSLAYRLKEGGFRIPIIFITASREAGLREKGFALGAAAFFEKPYRSADLMAKVAELLGDQPASAALVSPAPPPPAAARPASPKILVIEDDKDLAAALETRLRTAGYETVTAADADEGVLQTVRAHPALIVLDTSMTAADGFSVAEKIHSAAPGHAPFIFLTDQRHTAFFTKAERLQAARSIEKPYRPEDLLSAVRQCLPSVCAMPDAATG